MKKLKFEYKDGVMKIRPNNLFNIDDPNEAEEIVRSYLDNIKRTNNLKEKCHNLNFILSLSLGDYITKQCLFDILDYIDLDFKVFERYILFLEYKQPKTHFEREWFCQLFSKNGKN